MIGISDIGKVVVLVIALSAGEAAANSSQDKSRAVAYAELDLSSPAGAEKLYERLQRAAAEVCGFYQSSTLITASIKTDKQACYVDALSRAVAQIDAPLLKEQHEG